MPKGKKEFTVGLKYRTNPLSKTEGGDTLLVEQDNYIKAYPNIKNVRAYMRSLTKNSSVTRVWQKGENGEYDTLIYSS
jgi:hypothetical protein